MRYLAPGVRTLVQSQRRPVEDHLDELQRVYDDRFRSDYGPLHPRVVDLFERFVRWRGVETAREVGYDRLLRPSLHVRPYFGAFYDLRSPRAWCDVYQSGIHEVDGSRS